MRNILLVVFFGVGSIDAFSAACPKSDFEGTRSVLENAIALNTIGKLDSLTVVKAKLLNWATEFCGGVLDKKVFCASSLDGVKLALDAVNMKIKLGSATSADTIYFLTKRTELRLFCEEN